jgi:hypothetical protein
MIQGLPGIRLKLVKLACTSLRNISTLGMHSRRLPSSGWIHQAPPSGSAPHLILHMVHLAYLDEMKNASAWIHGNTIDDASHTNQGKYKVIY